MDATTEKKLWSIAADNIIDAVDRLFLDKVITGEQRRDFLWKLRSRSGLGAEFRARNWQQVLKEDIIERRGTDSKELQKVEALPFPDRKKKPITSKLRVK